MTRTSKATDAARYASAFRAFTFNWPAMRLPANGSATAKIRSASNDIFGVTLPYRRAPAATPWHRRHHRLGLDQIDGKRNNIGLVNRGTSRADPGLPIRSWSAIPALA